MAMVPLIELNIFTTNRKIRGNSVRETQKLGFLIDMMLKCSESSIHKFFRQASSSSCFPATSYNTWTCTGSCLSRRCCMFKSHKTDKIEQYNTDQVDCGQNLKFIHSVATTLTRTFQVPPCVILETQPQPVQNTKRYHIKTQSTNYSTNKKSLARRFTFVENRRFNHVSFVSGISSFDEFRGFQFYPSSAHQFSFVLFGILFFRHVLVDRVMVTLSNRIVHVPTNPVMHFSVKKRVREKVKTGQR